MKKRNKKLIIILSVLAVFFVLLKTNVLHSLVYYSSASHEWKKQGEERAKEYVQEKYGQEAEIISSKILGESIRWHFFGVAYGDVAVKMKMNGRKFVVLISGNDDREYNHTKLNAGNLVDSYGIKSGADDYQKEEIREAFIKSLNEKGINEIDDLDIKYGIIKYKNGSYKYMSSEYFDGSNYVDVAKSIQVYHDRYSFIVNTHEADLSGINVNDLTKEFGADNFRISNYQIKTLKNKYYIKSDNSDIVNQADKLIDCIICSNGRPFYYDFTLHGYCDIQYYALGGTYCNVSKLSESEYPENISKHKILSDLYAFDTDANIIIVYFENSKDKENGPIYFGFKSISTGEEFLQKCLDAKTPKGYIGGYAEMIDRENVVFAEII